MQLQAIWLPTIQFWFQKLLIPAIVYLSISAVLFFSHLDLFIWISFSLLVRRVEVTWGQNGRKILFLSFIFFFFIVYLLHSTVSLLFYDCALQSRASEGLALYCTSLISYPLDYYFFILPLTYCRHHGVRNNANENAFSRLRVCFVRLS